MVEALSPNQWTLGLVGVSVFGSDLEFSILIFIAHLFLFLGVATEFGPAYDSRYQLTSHSSVTIVAGI